MASATASKWAAEEAKLREFEALVDPNDPLQTALLEDMRRHTKLLQRGEWSKPERTNRRNWNAPPRSKGAHAIDDNYRAYKEHIAAEQQRQARQLPQPQSALAILAAVAEEQSGGGPGGQQHN